jgi:hypothetical protein
MISVLIVADELWACPALSGQLAADPVIEVAGITSSLENALYLAGGCRDGVPDAEIRRALREGRWTFWQMTQTMIYRLALDNRTNAVRVAIQRGWIESTMVPDEAARPGTEPTGFPPS